MDEQTSIETGLDGPGFQTTFLDRLADQLAPGAHAGMVFGAPVDRDGVTVIPVAKAGWGMGGGSRHQRERTEGPPVGGGGGVAVKPIGFIEVGAGTAKFRRISDSADVLRLAVAGGIFGASIVNAIARLRGTSRPAFRLNVPVWRRLGRALRR